MKLVPITPKKATKALLKMRPLRSEMDSFKANLRRLLERIDVEEHEEHVKNDVRDFLRDTFYSDYEINTKDHKDLVIHLGKSNKDKVGVIIEAKRPKNVNEMLTFEKPNVKALHELVLYYMNERFGADENIDIKHCIVTNCYEWYIFDASFFEKNFARDSHFVKEYKDWKGHNKVMADNTLFYNSIAKPKIEKIKDEAEVTYFDLRTYRRELNSGNDKKLIELFKVFSQYHLLRISAIDSNALNDKFYKELLHIIGLEEKRESGKVIIIRKPEEFRDTGSLVENTIRKLETKNAVRRVSNLTLYGETQEQQALNIAIELTLTWVNRILFLKLLEGQLINYHSGDLTYSFLDARALNDYDKLYTLFHEVLAISVDKRSIDIKEKYALVPYLNSSLFDISELESDTIVISELNNDAEIKLLHNSVLDSKLDKIHSLPSLQYLLRFLDAYDFGSESKDVDIQEDNKTLISAAVLGKVFEKINGYKDGSVYTPGFITMYMCKEVIRPTVIKRFNEVYSWNASSFDDLYNYLDRSSKKILEYNQLINSLSICDPSVGSGHFLVSALNELIIIKAELGILADVDGRRLQDYELSLGNDELIISDHNGEPFVYKINSDKFANKEMQRLQQTLFHEKQTIIENCLFGVDINPNSVKICRLRLWIELLKNAYYKQTEHGLQLETLPNIDINIKCGNSLVSRYSLDYDLSKALKSIKYSVDNYRAFVNDYKNATDKEQKAALLKIIETIKNDFKTSIGRESKEQKDLDRVSRELYLKYQASHLFDQNLTPQQKKEKIKLEKKVEDAQKVIEEIKNNSMFKNAFEWRLEFPEVLDENGNFIGFDIIIGNPPYIQIQKLPNGLKTALEQQKFETFIKGGDIYQLFYEKGIALLKKGGYLGYITSNKWMRTDYGSNTRSYLSSNCRVLSVVDFGMKQIFDSVTTYTNILTLSKEPSTSIIKMCRVKDDYTSSILLEDYVDFASVEIDNPEEKSWIAYNQKEYNLIKKISSQGKPLKEWNIKINRGLLTGFNEAFIISTEIRNKLIEKNFRSAEIIRPILRGEDIKAYVPQWADLWIINAHNGIKNSNISRIDVAQEYPAVYRWLSQFESQLKKRYDKGDDWTNLRNCAYLEEFYKPKIIYPNMTKYLPFVYDKHQFFTNQKCFIITGSNLGYLTAFFNSSIFRFAFKDYFPELLGDTRELSKVFFEEVTVREVDNATNKEFEILVEKVVDLKLKGLDSKYIELEIEKKLAKIYSLSVADLSLINLSETFSRSKFPTINDRSSAVNS